MGRDLALERAWRKRMREYGRSGLTIRDFCQRKGLAYHQFSWWRSELKRRAAKSESKQTQSARKQPAGSKRTKKAGIQSRHSLAASFVPVQVQAAAQAVPTVEIILDQPPRLRVSSGFDADLLRQVVGVLEQR